MTSHTHYALLGISPQADEATIRQAYRRAMRRVHPDRQRAPEAQARATAQAQEINQARDVLLDPLRRADYDRSLVPVPPPEPVSRPAPSPAATPASSPRPATSRPNSSTHPPRRHRRPSSPEKPVGVPAPKPKVQWGRPTAVTVGGSMVALPLAVCWGAAAHQFSLMEPLSETGVWLFWAGLLVLSLFLGVVETLYVRARWWWGPPRYRPFRLQVRWCLLAAPWTVWMVAGEELMSTPVTFGLIWSAMWWNLVILSAIIVWTVLANVGFWLAEPWAQSLWRRTCIPGPLRGSDGVGRLVYASNLSASALVLAALASWWVPWLLAGLEPMRRFASG